jgi:hypothetical protein
MDVYRLEDSIRINGRAEVSEDRGWLAMFPGSVETVKVTVEEVYRQNRPAVKVSQAGVVKFKTRVTRVTHSALRFRLWGLKRRRDDESSASPVSSLATAGRHNADSPPARPLSREQAADGRAAGAGPRRASAVSVELMPSLRR